MVLLTLLELGRGSGGRDISRIQFRIKRIVKMHAGPQNAINAGQNITVSLITPDQPVTLVLSCPPITVPRNS